MPSPSPSSPLPSPPPLPSVFPPTTTYSPRSSPPATSSPSPPHLRLHRQTISMSKPSPPRASQQEIQRERGKIDMSPEAITFRRFNVQTDINSFQQWVYPSVQTGGDIIRFVNNCVLPNPWFHVICLQGTAIRFVSFTFDPYSPYFSELASNLLAPPERMMMIATATVIGAVQARLEEDRQLMYVDVKVNTYDSIVIRLLDLGFRRMEEPTVASQQNMPLRTKVIYRLKVS